MKTIHPQHILVIDEIPLIAIGLQEVIRSIDPSARIEYTASFFTALSAKRYEEAAFDLIILGIQASDPTQDLPKTVAGLKSRFTNSRVMVYTEQYDPVLVEKIGDWGIDACVHKHEPVEEIRKACLKASAGETYLSGMLHTLYYGYRCKIPLL